MSWTKVASELSDPAVLVPGVLFVAVGTAVALRRVARSRQNRNEHRQADEIVNRTDVTRIRIPGYGDPC